MFHIGARSGFTSWLEVVPCGVDCCVDLCPLRHATALLVAAQHPGSSRPSSRFSLSKLKMLRAHYTSGGDRAGPSREDKGQHGCQYHVGQLLTWTLTWPHPLNPPLCGTSPETLYISSVVLCVCVVLCMPWWRLEYTSQNVGSLVCFFHVGFMRNLFVTCVHVCYTICTCCSTYFLLLHSQSKLKSPECWHMKTQSWWVNSQNSWNRNSSYRNAARKNCWECRKRYHSNCRIHNNSRLRRINLDRYFMERANLYNYR